MSYQSLKYKEVMIRKPHKCEFCRDQHNPGDSMMYVAGVMDGDFQSYYACLICDRYIKTHPDTIQDNEIQADFPFEEDYKQFKAQHEST